MTYIYKTTPINGTVDRLDPALIASKVNSIINSLASQGWEFCEISSVQAYTNPGCFDALFAKLLPGFGGANQAKYDIAVFRKKLEQEDFLHIKSKIQEEINNDSSKPHPDTHVKCPECKKLVRNEATQCRHCGCKLKPLDGVLAEEGLKNQRLVVKSKSTNQENHQPTIENPANKSSLVNDDFHNSINDEQLDEIALAQLNANVNPLLGKLKAVGYDLVDSKTTKSKTYWRLMYSRNGSYCEFNNIKDLQDFAANF